LLHAALIVGKGDGINKKKKEGKFIMNLLVKRNFTVMLVFAMLIVCFCTVMPLAVPGEESSLDEDYLLPEPKSVPLYDDKTSIPREALLVLPPYDNDYEPGCILVGFTEPYTGSFSNEEFPGLNVVSIKDSNYSLYESFSSMPNAAEQFDQDALNRLKERAGIDFQIYLSLETESSIVEAIQILGRNPKVSYATPNFILKHAYIPDDPYSISGDQGNTEREFAPDAWDITKGIEYDPNTESYPVEVGVLDTGVDFNHPDLQANIDTSKGWNIPQNNNNVVDYDGRGTHVSGIIGAIGDNGIGVAGTNWSVLFFNDSGKNSH
jgi:subtilisin family serine protease